MKPNTRIDNFLAKIAGDPDANTAMKPRSPEEYYLNQIAENGGGGGGGDVVVVHDDGALDKTWQEIYDAMAAGNIVVAVFVDKEAGTLGFGIFTELASEEAQYDCFALASSVDNVIVWHYATDSADGHPAYVDPNA